LGADGRCHHGKRSRDRECDSAECHLDLLESSPERKQIIK